MYIQVLEGWNYRPGARAVRAEQLSKLREAHAGKFPLEPEVPGLIARMFGTDPNSPDTTIAVWVCESKADADQWPWLDDPKLRAPLEAYMDLSQATIRGFDGLYFAHRCE